MLSDREAFVVHGLLHSEDDSNTSGDDCDIDEREYAQFIKDYKPPPIQIPLSKLITICSNQYTNTININDSATKKNSQEGRIKELPEPTNLKTVITTSVTLVPTNNYYKQLEIDSDEYESASSVEYEKPLKTYDKKSSKNNKNERMKTHADWNKVYEKYEPREENTHLPLDTQWAEEVSVITTQKKKHRRRRNNKRRNRSNSQSSQYDSLQEISNSPPLSDYDTEYLHFGHENSHCDSERNKETRVKIGCNHENEIRTFSPWADKKNSTAWYDYHESHELHKNNVHMLLDCADDVSGVTDQKNKRIQRRNYKKRNMQCGSFQENHTVLEEDNYTEYYENRENFTDSYELHESYELSNKSTRPKVYPYLELKREGVTVERKIEHDTQSPQYFNFQEIMEPIISNLMEGRNYYETPKVICNKSVCEIQNKEIIKVCDKNFSVQYGRMIHPQQQSFKETSAISISSETSDILNMEDTGIEKNERYKKIRTQLQRQCTSYNNYDKDSKSQPFVKQVFRKFQHTSTSFINELDNKDVLIVFSVLIGSYMVIKKFK